MRVLNVEPTPSPHTLRCSLNQRLDAGLRFIYSSDQMSLAPEWLHGVLRTSGVRSVMHVADFIAIDKDPVHDWKLIIQGFQTLELFGEILNEATSSSKMENKELDTTDDVLEVRVFIQQFMQLPIQWKILVGIQETRIPAPDRFRTLVMKLSQQGSNLIQAREWVELDRRYGSIEQIAEELRLESQVRYATVADMHEQLVTESHEVISDHKKMEPKNESTINATELMHVTEQLHHDEWRVRYQTVIELQQMDLREEVAPILYPLFHDSHYAVRRMAGVVYAQIKNVDVLPALIELLGDSSPIVRRTIADSLTDLGDRRALLEMRKLLEDPSRIVRWRAARFLFEFGDHEDLVDLEKAKSDDAFEVQLQIRMAIERIASGQEAAGSIWQQMGGGNT